MKRLMLLFALSGCATVRPLVIQNVTVIDGTGAPARSAMTVTIRGSRIAAIEPAAAPPRDANVIDGTGKFLIPGLWDMHTHASYWGEDSLATLVRNGVLAIRDLGGDLAQLDKWREEIDRGTRVGPRIFRAGPFVDGPKKMEPKRAAETVVVRTRDEGRAAVRDLKAKGVDLIKTHNGMSRDALLGVADEIRANDMLWAAHPPTGAMSIEEVSDAGAKSIEHIEMLTENIAFEDSRTGGKAKGALVALDLLTDERAAETFRRFVKNGTWYDPTLVAYRSFMQEAVDNAPKDPREWSGAAAGRTKMFNRFVDLVGMMHRIGVPLLIGSDFGPRPESVPYPVVMPGTHLHDELLLFVRAGLTPLETIKIATSEAARWMRVSDQLGSVSVGKEADLLLLDADPTADIANTRSIRTVIFRGKVVQ